MTINTNQELYNELLREGKILNTNIKAPYGNNVHKEYTENPYYNPVDRTFNIYYLKSTQFIQDIKNNPLFLGYVPEQIFNENDVWDLINANPISILIFDESYIQPNMYTTAVMYEPRLMGLMNDRFQTIETVVQVIKKHPLALQHVRDDLRYYYVCSAAVALDWRSIKFVPPEIIDQKMLDIVLQNQDAFLLDKVDRSRLDSDTYVKQLVRFPIDGATHIISTYLVNNAQRINEVIYFIENLDVLSPYFVFQNCDPKVLLHHEKQEALAYLLSQRPDWIQFLPLNYISEEIFDIALENQVYPKLDSITWTGGMIALAFEKDKKALQNLPFNRIRALGLTRLTETVQDALKNNWVDQLPQYFFTDDIVNNLDIRQELISGRDSFAYVLTQAHALDWERVLNLDCSLAEYRMLKNPMPTEMTDSFFIKSVNSYIAMAELDQTLERTIEFLAVNPSEIYSIPKHFLKDHRVMKSLVNRYPILGRYLTHDDILKLF